MTAFAINSGGTEYYDQKSGASVNATLDTWTISAGSTLVVRTDTYACSNHSVAAGSLDNVTSSGVGGAMQFDPTYTRQISYTGGSGNAPAYGTTISQGGVSGVFLGTWADWQSEPTVPGAAIPASGYVKLGGITGGAFAAGALTGITADSSGADIQSWIEIRGAETGVITTARVLTVSSVLAWFELGTTNGTAGQIIPCPTTATAAGVWNNAWIETSSGSGVYERFSGAGSQTIPSTQPTDVRGKIIWQTTSGIRIGHNGTSACGYLPSSGCKVRIPATILTNCTRSAGGSGARVIPHATLGTRQEFDTASGGNINLNGAVCQWYGNFNQAFALTAKHCAFSDRFLILEISSALDIDDCIVGPTQAQANQTVAVNYNYGGGTVQNCRFTSYNATNAAMTSNQNIGVDFESIFWDSLIERTSGAQYIAQTARSSLCTYNNCSAVTAPFYIASGDQIEVNDLSYADTFLTTGTSSPVSAVKIDSGTNGLVNGVSSLGGIANVHPYTSWVHSLTTDEFIIENIGTYASPINCGSANHTGYIHTSSGANFNMTVRRCYASNTRLGALLSDNSDNNITREHVYGDFADADVIASLNTTVKNCGYTGSTSGQNAVYGTHWLTRFTGTTAGFVEIVCNEPTTLSAAQCYIASGTPKFNSAGQILMVTSGQAIVWEMNFYALGYTAFTNTLPTITGTNVTSAGSGVWGNHLLEFQVNTGSGYGGSWLTLTAANLIAQTISPSTGFKLKIRATCQSSSSTNALTNIRVAMTTTSADQSANLYPLQTVNFSVTNIVAGSRMQIYNVTAGDELYNDVVSGTSYTTEFTGSEDDIVRVRLCRTTGATSYLPYVANAQATTDDFSLFVEQVADDVYDTFALDGPAITKFSADYGNDTTDIVLTTDYSAQEFYAWWIYNLTTEQGIREFFGGVTAADEANIRINATVLDMYLDNETTTNIVQSDNRRFYRDDGVYPVKRPTAGGGGVDVVWRNTILIATNDAANIAAAVHDYTVEDGQSFDEMFRVQHSALAGKVSGANTTTERFRDIADTKDRIVYTVDANGNRTAVTQDGTP